MNEPMPCPFCGSSETSAIVVVRAGGESGSHVHCYGCSATGPMVFSGEESFADATAKWNEPGTDKGIARPGTEESS